MIRKLLVMLTFAGVLLASLAMATTGRADVTTPAAGWSTIVLTEMPWGYYVHYASTDIGIDRQGSAHVSYRTPRYGLGYATNKTGCWSNTEIVQNGPSAARENALVVDGEDNVHISFSYDDGHDEDLMYATNETGGLAAHAGLDHTAARSAGYLGQRRE